MGGLGFGSHADSIAPVPWYSWVLNPLLGALLGGYIPYLFAYMQGIPFVDKSPSPEELSYTCAGMGAPHARAPNPPPHARARIHRRIHLARVHSRAPPRTGVVWGLFTPPLWTLSLVSFGTMIAYALLGVEDTRNDPAYDYSAWTEAILNVTATGKAVVASALRLG